VLGEIMELNSLTEPKENTGIDRIENEEDIWKIPLFDIWVENDDRKPSNPNMLRKQVGYDSIKLYALDHAFCFNSLKYTDLNPIFGVTQGFNDNILYTDLAKYLLSKNKYSTDFVQKVTSFFQEKISLSKTHFESLWSFLPAKFGLQEEDRKKMYNFFILPKQK